MGRIIVNNSDLEPFWLKVQVESFSNSFPKLGYLIALAMSFPFVLPSSRPLNTASGNLRPRMAMPWDTSPLMRLVMRGEPLINIPSLPDPSQLLDSAPPVPVNKPEMTVAQEPPPTPAPPLSELGSRGPLTPH